MVLDRVTSAVTGADPTRDRPRLDRVDDDGDEISRDLQRPKTVGQVAVQVRVHERAQHCDAEHGTELAAGVGGRRRHARVFGGHLAEGDRRHRHHARSKAVARQRQRRHQPQRRMVREQQQRGQQHTGTGEHAPLGHGAAGTQPRHPTTRDDGGGDHRGRHGHELKGDAVGRVANHRREVERREEEDGEDGEVQDEGHDHRAAEARRPEVLEIEQWRCARPFDPHEADEGDHADEEEPDNNGVSIAVGLAQDHREGHRPEPHRPGEKARHVETRRLRTRRFGDALHRKHHDEQRRADVEPEDAAPVTERHENAADHRPEGERQTRDRRPGADGPSSNPTIGKHMTDNGKGPRLRGGGADTHHHARPDQDVGIGRECAQQRTRGEEQQPPEHDLLTT